MAPVASFPCVIHKGRNLLIRTDGDIFDWLTLNNCSITFCRNLSLSVAADIVTIFVLKVGTEANLPEP